MFAIRTWVIPIMICVPFLISLAVAVSVTLSISLSIRVAASGVVRLGYRCCRLRRRTSSN
jgi:hypothetical protein